MREAVFRQRYHAYLREDAIAPNAGEGSADVLDESGNSWILASTSTVSSQAPFGFTAGGSFSDLPALNVFCDLLLPELAAGKTSIDATRFVIDRAAFKRLPELC